MCYISVELNNVYHGTTHKVVQHIYYTLNTQLNYMLIYIVCIYTCIRDNENVTSFCAFHVNLLLNTNIHKASAVSNIFTISTCTLYSRQEFTLS